MAQEGVLGRTSCRSWVSWACWGGPVCWSRTNPPAGWWRAEGSREAFWASRGHGKVLLPWMGFLPFLTVGGMLTAKLHPFVSQHRANTPDQHGACGPRHHRGSPECRTGARQNGARSRQGSCGGEEDASRVAQELPTAEIAGGRVWHHRASTECGRWQTHAGGRPRARRTWELLGKHPSSLPLVSSRPPWSAAQLGKRHRELRSNSSATAGAQQPCSVARAPS